MNDFAPPPNNQEPVSWQDTGTTPPPAPGFNPRRAFGGQPPNPASNPVMAPPPLAQSQPAPFPHAAQQGHFQNSHTNLAPNSPQNSHLAHYAPAAQAAPPYPAHAVPQGYPDAPPANPGYAQDYYDPQYVAPAAYDYASEVVEPAGGRASLLSRLTGKMKRSPAAAQTPSQGPAQTSAQSSAQTREPSSARKPFLMGLLVGIVLMLVLGQVFRAAQPSADYAAVQPTFDEAPYGDTETVAFLDTVEGLN